MNKGHSRTVWFGLAILLLTMGFGCSHTKAFKPGVAYTCDEGKGFVVEFYENVDIAFLITPTKRFYLHRVPSASGTKYSDGNTILWLKGQNAFVEIKGHIEFKNCSIKSK